ncbi:MAG: folylpolyglutamate synthase/dihydrofolate synthase family protein, partial [Candidatus Diapherotrites archaeon]
MNYSKALDFLNSFQERHHGFDLDKTREMVSLAGLDIGELRVVHVAGTNGKGSATAFISSILKEAGFKVGTYTSPHLLDVRERIRINGKKIPEEKFAEILNELKKIVEKMDAGPSYFELMTVAAIKYFLDEKVEIAVIEVGLGGRLDATNVLHGEICVFTDIAIDHTQMLGKTVEKIAAEKAAIIKEGSVVVLGEKNQGAKEIRKQAEKLGCKIVIPEMREREIGLLGEFQQRNAAVAVGAAIELGVSGEHIKNGLKRTDWPGRLQVLKKNPLVIVDSAHNVSAVKELMNSLNLFEFEKLVLVIGILKDKDFGGMM